MLINNALAELNDICLAVYFSDAFYSTTKLNSVCGDQAETRESTIYGYLSLQEIMYLEFY